MPTVLEKPAAPKPLPHASANIKSPTYRRPSLDFSLTGLVYCSMMMFMGLAAMNTQANLLFGVFGLMIGILIISVMISRIVLRKLKINRDLPAHAVVGESMTVYYQITNQKRRWPSLSVRLTELDSTGGFAKPPQCYLLHAAPTVTATVPVEILPTRRGLLELDHFQLSTSFPFGFIKRAVIDRRKDGICVFPALADLDPRVIALCRSADREGEASRPQPGGVDEFYGVREYRPGDNPRHIYWRRSARTGVLVSKDMTRMSPPRMVLLVDTYLPEPALPEQRARVERVIAMAASIAWTALEQELAVGLVAWSGKPVSLSPTRGKQQRDELLTVLARLPVNTTFDRTELLEHGEASMKSGVTLVVLTDKHFTPRNSDLGRGRTVVLAADSQAGRDWFRFRPEIDFSVREPG